MDLNCTFAWVAYLPPIYKMEERYGFFSDGRYGYVCYISHHFLFQLMFFFASCMLQRFLLWFPFDVNLRLSLLGYPWGYDRFPRWRAYTSFKYIIIQPTVILVPYDIRWYDFTYLQRVQYPQASRHIPLSRFQRCFQDIQRNASRCFLPKRSSFPTCKSDHCIPYSRMLTSSEFSKLLGREECWLSRSQVACCLPIWRCW